MKHYKDTQTNTIYAYEDNDSKIKDGLILVTDEELVILRTPSIKEQRVIDKQKNISITQTTIDSLTKDYPKFERDTFFKQEKEMEAYLIDNNSPTPFVDILAQKRDITRVEMMNKIQINVNALTVATASILGDYQAELPKYT